MPLFDTDVPVLFVRLDPNPFHHGTLGALRSLGRAGIEVHLLAEPAGGPVSRCRYLHRVHALPSREQPETRREGELEGVLLRVSESVGRPAVLIALDDRSAIEVAALAGRLAGRYLLPEMAPGVPGRVADKAELSLLCRDTGIAHPTTVAPGSPAEAAREATALGLPVIAKWSRPWLLPSGMRSTTLVRTPADAYRLCERSALAGSQLLLQRLLPGGRGTDWFFHGYAAGGSVLLAGGAGRKERSWPPRTGLTAVGTWLANREVEEAAARLAAAVGYRGVLDLDFRLDTETGAYHLLDFNPRPGAQFRLFTDESGLDVVRAQHLHLTGRTVPQQRGGPGRVFVAENYALLSAMATGVPPLRAGGDGGREPERPAARETRRVRGEDRGPVERAWFAADDPVPFFAMAGAWLLRCAGKFWPRPGPSRPRTLPGSSPGPPAAPHSRTPRDERSVSDQREGNACTTS